MPSGVGAFIVQTLLISMSGVLAPGPVTAATLAAGARRPTAGAWIAVGHGLVEFPLMALILAGAGAWLRLPRFQAGVGLAGGIALIVMACLMLHGLWRSARRPPGGGGPAADPTGRRLGPVWTGVVLTAGNPYFLVWWATVGLALATKAAGLGVLGFALFAVVHWCCDLLWLAALALASHRGVVLLGPRAQQVVTLVCAAAMGVFGVMFLAGALGEA